MTVFRAVLLSLGLVFTLSACHFSGHHPPGHGGIPPGQAKKGWHKTPKHHKGQQSHRRLEGDRTSDAPRFY